MHLWLDNVQRETDHFYCESFDVVEHLPFQIWAKSIMEIQIIFFEFFFLFHTITK